MVEWSIPLHRNREVKVPTQQKIKGWGPINFGCFHFAVHNYCFNSLQFTGLTLIHFIKSSVLSDTQKYKLTS